MRTSLGAAAACVVTGIVSLLSSRPAFAIDELPDRILSLHSLHLRGVMQLKGDHPLQIFLREPDCFRCDGAVADSNGVINTFDTVCSGDHISYTNHADKTVTIAPVNEQDARMQTAQMLQGFVQMMFGPRNRLSQFKKVRTEKVAGVQTDVYQSDVPGIAGVTIWFNPRTQLPVQTELDTTQKGGGDMRFDLIEADPVLADSVFHPAVPGGFAVIQPNLAAAVDPDAAAALGESGTFGDAHGNQTRISLRYFVSLGDGDVLCCWCLYDTADRAQDLKLPDRQTSVAFTTPDSAPYTEQLLHADATAGGWHWRWSLLHPAKAPGSVMAVQVAIRAHNNRGNFTELPVSFPPADLAKEVDTLQRQTLPAGIAPMTLEEIREGGKL